MPSVRPFVLSSAPSSVPTRVLAGPLALLLAACPGDDGTADADATTAGGTTTSGGTTTDGTTTAEDPTSSTTAVVDDTGTGTVDTTGEPPPLGNCVGFAEVGHIGLVLSRNGVPIDDTCEPTPAACGGQPVGSWVLESQCGFEAEPNPFEDECPGSDFEIEILSQIGTMTFDVDGSFVQDFDVVAQLVLTLNPMECFGLNCNELEMLLQMQTETPNATCDDMGPSCVCTFPDDGMPEQAMGAWEAIDGEIHFMAGGITHVFPFCIAEDRLELWQPIHAMPITTALLCASQQDCIDALGDRYDFYWCTVDEAPGG
jgi:hypothetical protein